MGSGSWAATEGGVSGFVKLWIQYHVLCEARFNVEVYVNIHCSSIVKWIQWRMCNRKRGLSSPCQALPHCQKSFLYLRMQTSKITVVGWVVIRCWPCSGNARGQDWGCAQGGWGCSCMVAISIVKQSGLYVLVAEFASMFLWSGLSLSSYRL